MGIRIDHAVGSYPSGPADDLLARAGDQLNPDLVGVDRPLTEKVADAERAHDHLDQVFFAWFQTGNVGAERAQQLAFNRAPVTQAEDIDAEVLVLQEPGLPRGGLVVAYKRRQPGVATDEEVVVNLSASLAIEVAGTEVSRGL